MESQALTKRLNLSFEARFGLVSAILERARAFMRDADQGEHYGILVVVRELVENAIVHGNRSDPTKLVKLAIRLCAPGLFEVQVEDEGQGFDYAEVVARLPGGANGEERSGYLLIHELADKVAFENHGSKVRVLARTDGARNSGSRDPKVPLRPEEERI
ncbi:MAG TPA: ATP-binding protein [Rectinemataceae bacterium]|nr:ATP-binding protein [Rectinemataceae bacterium]